ncbi:MAG TPA: glycine cleavage system protein H, partial [Advenella sp.]|nr:glycine cleavage system protein H [Advenella sp.]
FVGDFNVGAKLKAGETAGVVESVKAASDIYAPVDGEIVAFNDVLEAQPDLVNEDSYANWIYKIKPANAADADKLMDAAAYEAQA